MTDSELIALYQARDPRAVEETRAQYGAWCAAIARRLLTDSRISLLLIKQHNLLLGCNQRLKLRTHIHIGLNHSGFLGRSGRCRKLFKKRRLLSHCSHHNGLLIQLCQLLIFQSQLLLFAHCIHCRHVIQMRRRFLCQRRRILHGNHVSVLIQHNAGCGRRFQLCQNVIKTIIPDEIRIGRRLSHELRDGIAFLREHQAVHSILIHHIHLSINGRLDQFSRIRLQRKHTQHHCRRSGRCLQPS